jgi:flagellar biosynthetic protein FlhB
MSDKVHPPTPRRRKQAKEQGRAPRSSDLVSAGLLLATTGLLTWFGPDLAVTLMDSIGDSFRQPARLSIDRRESYRMVLNACAAIGYVLLPMLIAMMMCGVGFNLMQTGWMITPSKLVPSLDRLSPGKRIAAIGSARSILRVGITVLKLVAVIAVAMTVIRRSVPQLIQVTELPLAGIAAAIFETLVGCCVWVGATLFTFACVDFSLAWWQHERDLMMTEQELREEMRDTEGPRQPVKSARTRAVEGVA